MNRILVKLWVTLSMTVDVFPCLWFVERELGRHQTHNRSVFIMKLLDFEGPSASVKTPNRDKWRDLANERTGIFC
jgi:hypothetical protein